jgi:hypothetical protein
MYLFDNDREKTLERLKKHKEEYFTNKAFYTGIPRAQLQRQEGWVLQDAKNLNMNVNRQFESHRGGNPRGRGAPAPGNGRGFHRGFQGGGRSRSKFKSPQRGGRPNNGGQNQWPDHQDQPSSSGQPKNQNQQKNNHRNKQRGAGGGRGGGHQ